MICGLLQVDVTIVKIAIAISMLVVACPQLHSTKEADISRWVWQRKAQSWQNLDLTLVTPSIWLAECAHSSSLLKNFPS